MASCADWQGAISDADLAAKFADYPHPVKIRNYQVDNRNIRYLEVGADTLPTTLLVHGAPSSLTGWMGYLTDSTITSRMRLVAVDRPGYGGSDFGKTVTSVRKQSRMLEPLLDSLEGATSLTVIGSSYGGTLSARLAMDYPERFDRLVLISASLEPGQEKTYKISYYAAIPGIRSIVPTFLRLANEEKLSHYEQLVDMKPLWTRIHVPVTILHGDADDLIYYDNALYARKLLTEADDVELITVPKADHGLPWSHPELVKETMLKPLRAVPSDWQGISSPGAQE